MLLPIVRLFLMSAHPKDFSRENIVLPRIHARTLNVLGSSAKGNSVTNDGDVVVAPKKFHHLTVCMVPPTSNKRVWENISKCRVELRDPGLYRWPPHANLLYPFLGIHDESSSSDSKSIDMTIIESLKSACRHFDPFEIRLGEFGTFGGNKRGVLWIHPNSRNGEMDHLARLQARLVEQFPSCCDQNKKSPNGYTPHMTVSHFVNLDDALEAKHRIESWWPQDLQFTVDTIYLLQRIGDSGQFLRVADIPLGPDASPILHTEPVPFDLMPTVEAGWVREERMKLKRRRNKNGRRGHRRDRGRRNTRSAPRVMDSPEVIAAKRAARKAKREGAYYESDSTSVQSNTDT